MKSIIKLSSILLFSIILFSCGSSHPTDDNFFVGTYKGQVEYKGDNGDNISHNSGKVTVIKVASKTKYNFEFSNGIPNLNNVEFKKDGDKRMINVDFEDGVQFIEIEKSTLKIHYSKDGNTWKANLKR